MKKVLNALNFSVSRRKSAQLMKETNVWVHYKKKYKATTNSKYKKPVYENKLEQNFNLEKLNQGWVQDITYVWTSESRLYIAIVIYLYSRKVVGWGMSSRMKARLVFDALTIALCQRQPEAGLILHSDQRVQYASDEYVDY
jgi:putative transposase